MADKNLVLAIFKDEATADAAVVQLKEWDHNYVDIKFDAIGVLVLDDKGKIKTHKAGNRATGKGASIGLVLAMVTPPGLIAGLVVGGALGAAHRKGLGLDEAARDRLGRQLEGGKAAVGVLATADQSRAIMSVMKDLGGEPEVHDLDEGALDAAAEAAAAEPETAPEATAGATES